MCVRHGFEVSVPVGRGRSPRVSGKSVHGEVHVPIDTVEPVV
jgi:hypothetical protein